ncbi:hypothetical protein MANES_01G050766v8 [Manihot esculenta]|uniref:Uncharacterized protein n=1 Tax=Manihot esculenta TaxID=3983 RepID=A0ACB7IFJ7_MANES|nr:hypothetical protein MANES_01G050766v8 [Manihot esculenta]
MIGSLLYLTVSRLDIHFSVCLCARFQSTPKESHLVTIKIFFRYLISTPYVGLWYPKCKNFNLISYSDSDFAGSRMDRKSTSRTCQFLGHALVSWFSKKQTSVSLSIIKAKYIAAESCVAQILWMKQQFNDYGIKVDHHSRIKHIEIRHHFIRDHVQNGDINLEFVPIEKQLADIFTEPLSEEVFCRIKRELGMIDLE